MNPPDYNPHSPDSMFTQVLTRMDANNEVMRVQTETLRRIEDNTASGLEKFDKRLRSLEREKWKPRGLAAVAAAVFVAVAEWAKAKLAGH